MKTFVAETWTVKKLVQANDLREAMKKTSWRRIYEANTKEIKEITHGTNEVNHIHIVRGR